ncbi:hypothetical protein [Acidithiobacillus ferriphilus]|uniref:hypothetical protein n=1 Tax=Acidithiobacillus ferriphilus TaxID=1689834 RepID=UPI001C067E42|nr:hypothetical protein [Acidithiobacillus ferriphilus]MBU2852554.1 hypothetical protein [Acidithiobacillus ferriphilus]
MKNVINILISILMYCAFPRIANANVVTPGWWSTGYHAGYCVYDKNIIASLHSLELEIGRFYTGSSQYTTCNQGKWIKRNTYGYRAKMICTTVWGNDQREVSAYKIIFHKENKNLFSVSINSLPNGKYTMTYKLTKNKCPVIKYPWIDAETDPVVPIPLWLHNKLLKKFSGG